MSLDNRENAKYAVGIDLGTTHCVVAYRALGQDARAGEQDTGIHILPIAQLSAAGTLAELTQLPSFIYQAHGDEIPASELALPWQGGDASGSNFPLGKIAQTLGAKTPIRLVASAKSWLSHPGVDCHQAFLPIDGPEEVEKVSPYGATLSYLNHIKNAWSYQFPQAPLTQQQVTITVPASFDPRARELTAQAAAEVGLAQATLLEEPQAAFYSWVYENQQSWRDQIQVGDLALVVDIGGGTTDFSLISVQEENGELSLERIAVGEHILLGGDNMDLALAYRVKAKLEAEGKALQLWQINALTHGCRSAKEALLSDPELQASAIVVPSRGSKLIGGSMRTELTRQEVVDTLVEGFFPQTNVDELPRSRNRAALSTKSLPYAQDAAVTRHLAQFLTRQSTPSSDPLDPLATPGFLKPSVILFNGGAFKAEQFSQRLENTLSAWLEAESKPRATRLQGADLDNAVAKGAAYYGFVRCGEGIRIRGGSASAYYVGIESAMPAVPGMEPPMQAFCVAPFGIEEGTSAPLSEQEFCLVVGEAVDFRFFASTSRRQDQVGTLLEAWADDELQELEPITAKLEASELNPGQTVAVNLQASVTEVGTLRLDAIECDGDGRWKIEFNVRTG